MVQQPALLNICKMERKKNVCPRRELNPKHPTFTIFVTDANRYATRPPTSRLRGERGQTPCWHWTKFALAYYKRKFIAITRNVRSLQGIYIKIKRDMWLCFMLYAEYTFWVIQFFQIQQNQRHLDNNSKLFMSHRLYQSLVLHLLDNFNTWH